MSRTIIEKINEKITEKSKPVELNVIGVDEVDFIRTMTTLNCGWCEALRWVLTLYNSSEETNNERL